MSTPMSFQELLTENNLITQPYQKHVPPTFTLQGSQPYITTSKFMAGNWPPPTTMWGPKVRLGYIGWSIDIPKIK